MSSEKPVLHCWLGRREWIEEKYGFGSKEWADTFEEGKDGTCMLERDHSGEHEFIPSSEIRVTFR